MSEAMSDKTRGLYQKYIVTRADGASDAGAEYFVLRLDKGLAPERAALTAYAQACAVDYPHLAADLRHRYGLDGTRTDREETGSSEPDFVSGEGETPTAALDACADALDRDAQLHADLYEDDEDGVAEHPDLRSTSEQGGFFDEDDEVDPDERDCLTCGGSREVWSELDLDDVVCPVCSGLEVHGA